MTNSGKRLRVDRMTFSSVFKAHLYILPTKPNLLLLLVTLHCWSRQEVGLWQFPRVTTSGIISGMHPTGWARWINGLSWDKAVSSIHQQLLSKVWSREEVFSSLLFDSLSTGGWKLKPSVCKAHTPPLNYGLLVQFCKFGKLCKSIQLEDKFCNWRLEYDTTFPLFSPFPFPNRNRPAYKMCGRCGCKQGYT